MHGTLYKIDLIILGHKTSFNKNRNIKIISCILSDYYSIKLDLKCISLYFKEHILGKDWGSYRNWVYAELVIDLQNFGSGEAELIHFSCFSLFFFKVESQGENSNLFKQSKTKYIPGQYSFSKKHENFRVIKY